ncbi:tetratricopeptide repeat protein [Streptomyces sp. NPDC002838]|uniref:tetratricopeptide repeat protein n=1 Tax=Streptomyces sp. NPDC002838 TaxID=3154436 RepID=UPI003325EFFB
MAETDAKGEEGSGRSVSNRISGGVFFHAVIQGRDITVVLPPEITPALSGLPAASPTFTGRDTDMEQLLQGLAPDGAAPKRAVSVAAVAGLAGVGKTELVVQSAARALRKPGWFPGGVLFVDLFGYDTKRRLLPDRALDGLLRALGMPGEHIPVSLQDRTRLYRSVLAAFAEQSRRILVVIDNASTAEQARPLLPTDGVTAALLTSRHTLDVDARLHDLDVLNESASIELLHRSLRHARGPADSRVQDDPEAAATVARLCAGLPLALRIAAALLADTPIRPLASLAQDLEAEHSRLDELCREDRAVRAAFDLSYQHLDDQHARLFRLLSLNPGPDLSTESAVHLADFEQRHVNHALQDLARAHLIEPGHTWGRWRLHDLVRLYADEQGRIHDDTDQRKTARARLFTHYQATTRAADTHLTFRPEATSALFSDRNSALAWLDDERLNLIATATTAAPLGYPETSTALAFDLARYLDYRRSFDDLITVSSTALNVFRELGDRHSEGQVLDNLGNALWQVRRFDEAIEAHARAATLFRETGDRQREGQAVGNLGVGLGDVRRFDEAIEAHAQAATIARAFGDRHREGTVLGNLSLALHQVGRFDEAIEAHAQAATLFRETGDRHREGTVLNHLGLTLRRVGRFDEAIEAHAQAATLFRETGDRHREGQAVGNLGIALAAVLQFDEAIEAHAQAVTLFRETGDRHREGQAVGNLGSALWHVRRFDEAIEAHAQAVTLFRETGDRHSASTALQAWTIAHNERWLRQVRVERPQVPDA